MVQIKPFQGGEFNQVQTTDYVPELQRGYEKYNRSVDRAEGFARQNDERLIKMAGQSWEALAELSGSLQKFVGQKVKEKQAADMAKGFNDYHIHGMRPSTIEAFKAEEKRIEDEDTDLSKIIVDMDNEPESNIFVTERMYKTWSASRQLGFVKAWSQQQLTDYNPGLIPEIQNALDPAQRNAALTAYRQKFYERFEGMNPALVHEYVIKAAREKDKTAYNSWYTKVKETTEAARTEEASIKLDNSLQRGDGEAVLAAISTQEWRMGGIDKAREWADKRVLALIKGNALGPDGKANSRDTLEDIITTEFKGRDGGIHTLESLWPGLAKKWHKQMITTMKGDFEDAEAVKEVAAKTMEQRQLTILQDHLDKNGTLPDKLIDESIAAINETHGWYDPAKLKKMKQQSSLTAVQLRKSEKELEKLVKTGGLTEDKLAEFPYQLQRKWADVARLQTTAATTTNTHTKIIAQMIKSRDKLIPGGDSSGSGVALEALMRAKYHTLIAEGLDAEAAFNKVRTDLEIQFEKKGFITKDGFDVFPPKTDVARRINNHTKEMGRRSKLLDAQGEAVINTPGAIYDKTELTAMESQFGPNFRPSKELLWWTEKTGVNPLVIINGQRKALDMKPLEDLPSFKFLDENYGKSTMQKLCSQNLGTKATCSELGKVAVDKTSIFNATPKFVDSVKTESITQGATPNKVLAAVEMSILNPTIFQGDPNEDGADIFNKLSDDEKKTYHAITYKYAETPEEQEEALNNLLRDRFTTPDDIGTAGFPQAPVEEVQTEETPTPTTTKTKKPMTITWANKADKGRKEGEVFTVNGIKYKMVKRSGSGTRKHLGRQRV